MPRRLSDHAAHLSLRAAWHRRCVLGLISLLTLSALADNTNRVQRLALDPDSVVSVPVATDRLTTVRFPNPISGLEAAFVATEPHPDARFLLSFQPGNAFFSLRAAAPEVSATLNVVSDGQTYVLELVASDKPWLSLIFEAPVSPVSPTGTEPSQSLAPSRLLGLLDTARAYPLLKQQRPGLVADIQYVRPNKVQDHGDYVLRLEEVLRFDAEDTLVFHLTLINPTPHALRYLPHSLMVRVGGRVHFQTITDAGGVVPPHTQTPVYFAITGSPDGSRNDLSPLNDFQVLLSRFPPEPSSPPSSTGQPLGSNR